MRHQFTRPWHSPGSSHSRMLYQMFRTLFQPFVPRNGRKRLVARNELHDVLTIT